MSKDQMVTTARSFVAGHQERGAAVLNIIQRPANDPALKISLSAQLIAWGFRLANNKLGTLHKRITPALDAHRAAPL